jgi:hypothetical protein
MHIETFLLIAVLASSLGCLLFYILTVWNHTTMPLRLCKAAAAITDSHMYGVRHTQTRKDWQFWLLAYAPAWFSEWALCHICQSPWWTALLYLPTAVIFAVMGIPLLPLLPAACLSLGLGLWLYRATSQPESPTPNQVAAAAPPQMAEMAEKEIEPPAPELHIEEKPSARLAQYQQAYGLRMIKTDSGTTIDPTSITDEYKKMTLFFSDDTPCWFAGCEELRARYAAETKKGDAKCEGCELAHVYRKYALLALHAVRESNAATN